MISEKFYLKPKKQISGTVSLIRALKKFGVTFYSGVTGGGVVPLTKLFSPSTAFSQIKKNTPHFLTLPEYISGFVPLGYYLASGKISASVATTGAAIKLTASGMTDAKLHNIPAIYIFALNSASSNGLAPLQDVSSFGMNIIPQIKAELGDGCIVIKNALELNKQFIKIKEMLDNSRPVAILFRPDILSKKISADTSATGMQEKPESVNINDIRHFLNIFPKMAKNKRVILCVCEEATRCKNIKNYITQLSRILKAPTVWTINGANAVSAKNPYGYGYIIFGGNDKAVKLWSSVNKKDIVIMLGFDPGEYSLDLKKIPADFVWHFTNLKNPYGSKNGTFRHRTKNGYGQVRGNICLILKEIIPKLRSHVFLRNRPEVEIPVDLNTRKISGKVKKGCVDLISFYKEIQKYWQPNSIGFDDVCTASKDRQCITERPHDFIKFYSLYNGYAMGNALGLAIGAKIANPGLYTFIFSGDGCWRLFGSALADAANLGLRLFIFNNGTYGIVDQGIRIILPNLPKNHYHTKLPAIDFIRAAKAHGWDSIKLKADLINLKEIMEKCYSPRQKSLLIEVPSDPDQIVGLNFRYENLRPKHAN